MTFDNAAQRSDDLLAQLMQGLSIRTLQDVAEEARQDGETLRNAVERYEIDYAWHVLASDRLRDEVLLALETRLGQPVGEAQRAQALSLLAAASAAQPTAALMSFDNDVPELLGGLLGTGLHQPTQAEAA
jgi:hypothetical protein